MYVVDKIQTHPYVCDGSEKMGGRVRVVVGCGTMVDSPNIPLVRNSLSEARYLGDDLLPCYVVGECEVSV